MNEPILQTITPVTHDLGGFKVRRVLPGGEASIGDSDEFIPLPQVPTTVSYP